MNKAENAYDRESGKIVFPAFLAKSDLRLPVEKTDKRFEALSDAREEAKSVDARECGPATRIFETESGHFIVMSTYGRSVHLRKEKPEGLPAFTLIGKREVYTEEDRKKSGDPRSSWLGRSALDT